MLSKIKPLGFTLFAKRYGEAKLLECLEKNEKKGIVYHREGIFGDYDEFDDVDSSKIGVAGDSAGATLAAIVTNQCDKNNLPILTLQMLIYPLTGVNLQTESMKTFTDTSIWRSTYNNRMWKYYFANKEYDYKYSPMHMVVPKELPITYIETAEYDCLHDDGILYADKLRGNGIKVIVNETKKTIHGYDSALDAQVSKNNIEKRVTFLKENFT